jgi:DNA primase
MSSGASRSSRRIGLELVTQQFHEGWARRAMATAQNVLTDEELRGCVHLQQQRDGAGVVAALKEQGLDDATRYSSRIGRDLGNPVRRAGQTGRRDLEKIRPLAEKAAETAVLLAKNRTRKSRTS